MYSCKAGASGVGNVGSSVKIVNYLVELGCDLQVKGWMLELYSSAENQMDILYILLEAHLI